MSQTGKVLTVSYLKVEIKAFTKYIFKIYHRGTTLYPESLCAAGLLYQTILTEPHESDSGKFGQS